MTPSEFQYVSNWDDHMIIARFVQLNHAARVVNCSNSFIKISKSIPVRLYCLERKTVKAALFFTLFSAVPEARPTKCL